MEFFVLFLSKKQEMFFQTCWCIHIWIYANFSIYQSAGCKKAVQPLNSRKLSNYKRNCFDITTRPNEPDDCSRKCSLKRTSLISKAEVVRASEHARKTWFKASKFLAAKKYMRNFARPISATRKSIRFSFWLAYYAQRNNNKMNTAKKNEQKI